jgi:pimeloyl-ACP methyl ester carboxylesterase
MSGIKLDKTFSCETSTHSYTTHYTSLGPPASTNAQPVIFVHGTPWSHKVWIPYALSLSRKFHVYLSDNPGFGVSPGANPLPSTTESTRDDLDASLRGHAEVFAALLKHWKETDNWGDVKPHVIAHDNGGLISLRAALQHGCEYTSLCLIDVVAVPPFGHPLFQLVDQNVDVFKQIPENIFAGTIEGYISGAVFKRLDQETMEMLKQPWLDSKNGIQGTAGFVRQMQQAGQRDAGDVAPRYGEIGRALRNRIKIIWGGNDEWLPSELAERLASMIGGEAEVVLIDDAGHLLHYDQPASLGVELGMWLATMSSR